MIPELPESVYQAGPRLLQGKTQLQFLFRRTRFQQLRKRFVDGFLDLCKITAWLYSGHDVKLTADLVSFAFLDKYDTVYLLTGDADFLQALFSIKRFHNKKKPTSVGFFLLRK